MWDVFSQIQLISRGRAMFLRGLGSEVTYLQNIQVESICPTSSLPRCKVKGQMCLFEVRLLCWTAEPG